MRTKLLSLMAALILAAVISAPAAAYLKFDGIDGEATDPNHPGAIEILSWNWGGNQPGMSRVGGGGKVSLQDFHFVMAVSKASPKLMLACANGSHIPQATLTLTRDNSTGGSATYYKVTFSDLIVSSYQSGGGDSDDRPTEQVSLNFTKIKFEYTVEATGEIITGEYDFTPVPVD